MDSLNERILHSCHAFLEEDESRCREERNPQFFEKFRRYMRESAALDNILRRGCQDDLRSQWTANENTKERELHSLLKDNDDIQRISVDKLIDQMKDAGKFSSYKFLT